MTMEVVKRDKKVEEEYTIKPEASTPSLDTSTWPLLLKNYEKRKHCVFNRLYEDSSAHFLLQFSSERATSPRSPMAPPL